MKRVSVLRKRHVSSSRSVGGLILLKLKSLISFDFGGV